MALLKSVRLHSLLTSRMLLNLHKMAAAAQVLAMQQAETHNLPKCSKSLALNRQAKIIDLLTEKR